MTANKWFTEDDVELLRELLSVEGEGEFKERLRSLIYRIEVLLTERP